VLLRFQFELYFNDIFCGYGADCGCLFFLVLLSSWKLRCVSGDGCRRLVLVREALEQDCRMFCNYLGVDYVYSTLGFWFFCEAVKSRV
jgi:hypothetical protein